MIARKTKMLWILLGSTVLSTEAYPCSVSGAISNVKLVNDADTIVRVTAMEYALPPTNPQLWTTGVPDSKIRFKVTESIRGPVTSEVVLPGYLVDRDDFNDQRPPYS